MTSTLATLQNQVKVIEGQREEERKKADRLDAEAATLLGEGEEG